MSEPRNYNCTSCYVSFRIEVTGVPGEETEFDRGDSLHICPNCGQQELYWVAPWEEDEDDGN